MGLDMYLYKKTYVQNWSHMPPEKLHTISIVRGDNTTTGIKPERISYITESVGYWRKFNALHKWFVENCQDGNDDCKTYYVATEKLELLLETLKKIKADHTLAEELLPTEDGFFFGGTEYDSYYFENVDDTVELLEGLLQEEKDMPSYSTYEYNSSW